MTKPSSQPLLTSHVLLGLMHFVKIFEEMFHKCHTKRNNHFLNWLSDAVGRFCCEGTMLTHVHLSDPPGPFSQDAPQPVLMHEVALFQMPYFAFTELH